MTISITTLLILATLILVFFIVMKSAGKPKSDNCDPISEAEIYIAYGKQDEAIKCLENAIINGAGDDVKKKLIELKSQGE